MTTTVAANDMDGDSYWLGVPVHMTIENLLAIDYIIQEPPKHIDCFPIAGDPTQCDVVNISAYPDVNFSLQLSHQASLETTVQDTVGASLGASFSESSEDTIGYDGGEIGEANLTESETFKANIDFKSSETNLNRKYSSNELDYNCQTSSDDCILTRTQNIDIWRYPVIGLKDKDGKQVFIEIIVPGAKLSHPGPGTAFADWYQPIHQNHNLFSYPQYTGFPSDVGSFSIPGGAPQNATLNDFTMVLSWPGVNQSESIIWKTEYSHQQKQNFDMTLSTSLEMTTGVEASAKVGPFKGGTKDNVSLGFNAGVSLSQEATQTATNSNSTGITLNLPDHPGSSSMAYNFEVAAYIGSQGGPFKVAGAVDLSTNTSGRTWYASKYGSQRSLSRS
jgi:hypothetical protein